MKEFEKWWKKERRVDTLAGYRNDEDVWRAALEWVLKHRKPYYNIEDKKVVATDSDIIYEELEQ